MPDLAGVDPEAEPTSGSAEAPEHPAPTPLPFTLKDPESCFKNFIFPLLFLIFFKINKRNLKVFSSA